MPKRNQHLYPFTLVRLDNPRGEQLTAVNVPTSNPMPEVIIYGGGFFLRQSATRYREVIAWCEIDPVPAVVGPYREGMVPSADSGGNPGGETAA